MRQAHSLSDTSYFLGKYNEVYREFNLHDEDSSESARPARLRDHFGYELIFYGIGLLENYLADLLETYMRINKGIVLSDSDNRYIIMFHSLEMTRKLETIAYLFKLGDYTIQSDKPIASLNKIRNLTFHFQRPYMVVDYEGNSPKPIFPNKKKDTTYSTDIMFRDIKKFHLELASLLAVLYKDIYGSLRNWDTKYIVSKSGVLTETLYRVDISQHTGVLSGSYLVVNDDNSINMKYGIDGIFN